MTWRPRRIYVTVCRRLRWPFDASQLRSMNGTRAMRFGYMAVTAPDDVLGRFRTSYAASAKPTPRQLHCTHVSDSTILSPQALLLFAHISFWLYSCIAWHNLELCHSASFTFLLFRCAPCHSHGWTPYKRHRSPIILVQGYFPRNNLLSSFPYCNR